MLAINISAIAKITSYSFTSPGEGCDSSKIQTNFLTKMQKLPKSSLSCGKSTCPKTPQSGFLGRSLRPCPKVRISPERSQTAIKAHTYSNHLAVSSMFIETSKVEKQQNLRGAFIEQKLKI